MFHSLQQAAGLLPWSHLSCNGEIAIYDGALVTVARWLYEVGSA